MARRSWTSVRVEFLDRDKAVESLREAARQLRQTDPRVDQVMLFGSLVKGDYVPGSDADVLVVLQADPRPFLDRTPEFRRHFLDAPSTSRSSPIPAMRSRKASLTLAPSSIR